MSGGYDREKGCGISIINVEEEEKVEGVHWHNEGVLWLFEPTNYTHYTYPATNAYYMMKDMGWSESTRLLRFVPGKMEPELAFDFGVAICASRGMPSEDERYFYMLVYKGYMTYDKPEWASKPRLVVVDMKEKKMEFVDIPLEELFEVPYLDDYGTGWCSVWNGYVYVTPYYTFKGFDGTALIKYDPSTKKFTRVTPIMEGGILGLSIIDDKAVLLRDAFPDDVIITVVDLKEEKVLVEDVDISQHD